MAISVVQSKVISGSTSGSFSSPTTAGNTVIVIINLFQSSSGGVIATTGVTLGGLADHFAEAVSALGGTSSNRYSGIWADPNCAGGKTTVTVSYTSGGAVTPYGIVLLEVAGLATASVTDQATSTAGNGPGATWDSGTTATTTVANELWVGAVSAADTVTPPGSPWTNFSYSSVRAKGGYQIVSVTGTARYNGALGSNADFGACIATFKGASTTVSGAATLAGAGALAATGKFPSSAALAAVASLASSATVFTPPPVFPGRPPNALGLKTELLLGSTWQDVTQYVMYRDGLDISNMGRVDESGSITAGQLTLTFKNDGRFTPKNSAGAYYPNIVRNCQVRVSINVQSKTGSVYSGYRFWGEISSWPPGYDISQHDTYVQVTASGIWRRISANQVSIGSCHTRYATLLTGTSVPAAYWPMEDGATSAAFVLAAGTGSNLAITGTSSFAADGTSFAGSDALPQMNGARYAASVSAGPAPANNVIRFALSVPAAGDSSFSTFTLIEVAKILSGGTVGRVDVVITSGNQLRINGYLTSAGGTPVFSGTIGTKVNGTPVLVSAEITPNGSAINWALKLIKPNSGTVLDQVSGTRATSSVGAVTSVFINGQGRLQDTTLGQLGVWYAVPAIAAAASAIGGRAGEFAVDRFTRICGEFGITAAVTGSTSAAMGPQADGKLADILQSVEDTDGGLLYETRDQFGLGYRTLGSLQNQPAAVTVDYPAGVLGAPLTPTYDDQLIANQWTVTNYDGYSALAQVTSGAISTQAPPNGVGSGYARSKTINASSDTQANAIAKQLLFQGSTDEVRYPVVGFNFARSQAAPFFSSVPALKYGDYLAISNLPAFLGGGTTRQLIWGYTERLTGMTWEIGFNTIPEAPFETAFSPGVFSVAQAVNGGIAAGSGVGSTVTGAQLGPGAALPGTISARTIGGITQFIASATPYDWSFGVSGTPVDNSYFTCTQDQALGITAGDTFTVSGGLGGPFTVTSADPPAAGFINIHFTPDATSAVSSGQTVFGGKNGDTWVNTSAGNQVNQWQAGAWVPITWDASQVIQANTISAVQIAAGTVIAGVVDGTVIEGVTIIATGASGDYLAYSGTPASGNLIFSVSASAGTDGFSNSYLAGSTSYTLSGGTYLATSIAAGAMKTYTATSYAGPWTQIGNSGSAVGGDFHFGATGGAHLVADTRWFGVDGSGNRSDWTDFPAFTNSWGRGTGGYGQYRKLADGNLAVTISLRTIGTKADGTTILSAGTWADSTFWPSSNKFMPASMDTSGAAFYSSNHTPYLSFNTDGSVAVEGVNATGLSRLECHGIVMLN